MAYGPGGQQPARVSPLSPESTTVALVPTNHPRVPRDLSQLWLAPVDGRKPPTGTLNELASAVKLEVDGNFVKALPILSQPSLSQGPLGPYGEYYKGLAELRLGHPEQARRTFQALQAREIVGYLSEGAALREAECDEALADHAAALKIYERLSTVKTTTPDDVLMRMGRAAKASGDDKKATRAFSRVYYEYPFSELSPSAGASLESGPISPGSQRYKLGLDRAERLFKAKRYGQARNEFETLRNAAEDDDRERVGLRLAECDYFLKRPRNARDELRPYLEHASRRGEVLFFHALAVKDLGDTDGYLSTLGRVIADFGKQSWAEDALNSLASYQIVRDEDDRADETLRELYANFPTGPYAERAAWKIGWLAYKKGNYADTARFFEKAASDFPRSDYRPPWLYWSGRAHDALKETAPAEARYTLAASDYLNSYYGRLATRRLADMGLLPPARRLVVDSRAPVAPVDPVSPAVPGVKVVAARDESTPTPVLPPNAALVRALLDLDFYDQAIDELHYAQKAWGDSSVIQATLAWIYVQQSRSATGTEQFDLLRGAINAMKRAYPQYLAAGGEELPKDVLAVIFPLGYWDLIRKYAAQYALDPYLAAALIAQESTFVHDIKSYANAYGLSQLLPSTAKQYARILKLPYTTSLLTNPDANVHMGMAYFADKIKEFGDVHLALASYNAGERSVHRWIAEKPGMPRDEFIDDIPYPQTQQYVKKIIGTAEDYRRLYSSDSSRPNVGVDATPTEVKAVRSAAASASPAPAPKKKGVPARKKKTRKAT